MKKFFYVLVPLFLIVFISLFLLRISGLWPLASSGQGLGSWGESKSALWTLPLLMAFAFTAITGLITATVLFVRGKITGKFLFFWLLANIIIGMLGVVLLFGLMITSY